MAKRGNGEGSIRQLSSGKFEGRITVGYDEKGRQVRRSVYGETRREVANKLHEIRQSLQSGTYADPTRMTVGQLLDQWLEWHKPDLRETTISNYESMIEKHLRPVLGHVVLPKLHTHQIQVFLNTLKQEGLSARTVKLCYQILNMALKYARTNRIIGDRLSTENIKLPKEDAYKEVQVFEIDAQLRFLKAIQGHRLEAAFILMLALGLRMGECLSLQWSDIQFDKGVLKVRKTLQHIYNRHAEPGQRAQLKIQQNTKTEAGVRDLPLDEALLEALAAHRDRQNHEKDLAATGYQDQGLVFCGVLGTPMNPSNFRRIYKRILEKEQLPPLKVHAMRHSSATRAIEAGVDMKVLQTLLGHKDMYVTANTYSHVMLDRKRDALKKIQSLMSKDMTIPYGMCS